VRRNVKGAHRECVGETAQHDVVLSLCFTGTVVAEALI
jgi:hypothetical protein